MKILFDHEIFWLQHIGGISKYFAELYYEFNKMKYSINTSAIFINNLYLHNYNKDSILLPQFKGNKKIFFIFNTINNIIFKKKIQNTDILHQTYYNNYAMYEKTLISTSYDCTLEKYPELFPKKELTLQIKKQQIFEKSKKIIAISKNTKKDTIKYYKINPNKIKVIPLGVKEITKIPPKITLPKNYVLFVGSRTKYKNFNFLIKSIKKYLNKELRLVCIGKPFNKEELLFLKKQKVLKYVINMHANDNELAYIYSKAKTFIFPSLYEGFGLPILEAMINKTPVLLSKSSCFPEIAKKHGIYFNPQDINSLQDAIEHILTNGIEQNKLERAYKYAKKQTWEKTAKETIKLYKEALK